MRITRVRLYAFRSYNELVFEPSGGLNAIIGPNAAGKTNILEAMFLAALGKSHRAGRDAELINRASRDGYVCVELVNRTGAHRIEFKLREGERKQVLVDGQKLQRIGELMGTLNVVMFSPEDLSLVKDSPQERRRFMDMELCQLRPAYFYRLQQYNSALKQRGALLKDSFYAPPDADMLEAWDSRLAALGGDIMRVRRDFMDDISTAAHDLHRRITSGREEFFAYYKPNVPFEGEEARRAVYEALAVSHDEDIKRGCTTRGPHRDDVGLRLDDMDVRVYGSQGQQRTAALSLKLSELALMRREKGEAPVLLLDDVLSELDYDRQRELMSSAFDCQCFLTAAASEGLEGLPGMTVFECANGRLERV